MVANLTNDKKATIIVVGEKVLLRYTDQLGGERFAHLMYVTPTSAEWRQHNMNITVSLGTVEWNDEGFYIKIPLPASWKANGN